MANETTTPNTTQETSLVKTEKNDAIQVGFDTVQGFQALQRIGVAFSNSSLVPPEFQGQKGLANAIIAVEMAMRMKASPIMVMQNLYVVYNRPSWSAKFLIACFNTCGRFEAIQYEWTGKKGTDSWGCIAYTKEIATGKQIRGPEITIALAKKEGWYNKNGSKWQSIPELMLMYRSASWMINTTAPEIAMGLRTSDEETDIGPENSTRIVTPEFSGAERRQPPTTQDADFSDADADSIAEELAKARDIHSVKDATAEEVGANKATGEFELS